ncbi:hypothetical protein MRX96_046100 [Rhipicephalus microplus]
MHTPTTLPDSALNKASLLHACQYQDDTGRFCNPKWVDLNSHGEYRPSYNISPRNYHFFEWKTEESGDKQPYYVYFKQPRGVDMMKREWDHVTDAHQLMHNGHWIGPRLLTMAGIFDVSTSKLILDGDEAVASWLDPTYSFEELTYSVRCPPNLVCHPVSPGVAKVTNNTVECVLPYHSGE